MKKKILFSKKSSDYNQINNFINRLEILNIKEQKKIEKIYRSQKLRKLCKNCQKSIKGYDIIIDKNKYKVCKVCKHLNGIYEETSDFFNKIYVNKKGKNFTIGYTEKNFKERVKNIYLPKIKFLKSIIGRKKILDFGSGSGYFQAACENMKVKCLGLEVNEILSNFANKKLKSNKVEFIDAKKSINYIENYKYDCLSLINVLEHLLDPNEVIQSFLKSNAKYLFINVPLFSFSTLIDSAFHNNYRRQIGGTHTHLYTKESLEYLWRKYKLKIIGEWWYGLDFFDLSRNLSKIVKFKKGKSMIYYEKYFHILIDEFQSVLDKKKLSSEVHFVLKK